jgi:hypothetical protein
MTKEEIMKLLAIIHSSFPNHYKNFDEMMLKLSVQMWHKAFEDQSFPVVFGAVSKYILSHKFPPTIADIREEVVNMVNPKAMKSSQEAWEEVILAIKKFGFYRQGEGIKTLDETSQRAVRTIGWDNICKSENIGIERSNFYKLYDALNKGTKEQAILPTALYDAIQKATERTKIEGAPKNEVSKL